MSKGPDNTGMAVMIIAVVVIFGLFFLMAGASYVAMEAMNPGI